MVLTARKDAGHLLQGAQERWDAKGRSIYGDAWDSPQDRNLPLRSQKTYAVDCYVDDFWQGRFAATLHGHLRRGDTKYFINIPHTDEGLGRMKSMAIERDALSPLVCASDDH